MLASWMHIKTRKKFFIDSVYIQFSVQRLMKDKKVNSSKNILPKQAITKAQKAIGPKLGLPICSAIGCSYFLLPVERETSILYTCHALKTTFWTCDIGIKLNETLLNVWKGWILELCFDLGSLII